MTRVEIFRIFVIKIKFFKEKNKKHRWNMMEKKKSTGTKTSNTYQKRRMIYFQQQALSQLASSDHQVASIQMKKIKTSTRVFEI